MVCRLKNGHEFAVSLLKYCAFIVICKYCLVLIQHFKIEKLSQKHMEYHVYYFRQMMLLNQLIRTVHRDQTLLLWIQFSSLCKLLLVSFLNADRQYILHFVSVNLLF